MRLRRTGAKKQPRYRVVIAEARTPRDGAFIETIGYYDPLTEPSTVSIDRDKALGWLSKGAQPSDTVVRLLKRAGITSAEDAVKGGGPDGSGTDAG
jgi:small subunit ribosomal protein S16